jgi:ferritin-like metal-binding protein YciE
MKSSQILQEESMQTGKEFFIHGLNDIYDAEQQLVEALGELEQDSNNGQLKKAFGTHRDQTEKQVQRLDQVFETLGEQPEQTECHGIRGIIQEKKSFQEEDPSPDLVDVFNVGGGIKTEQYEIAEYESLIDLARELGENKIVKLLSQTLKEEQATLKKMQQFEKKIKPEQMGAEMEEEEGTRSRRSRRAA